MLEKCRGVIPALLTPTTQDGQLDLTALPRLLDYLVAKGIDGIYITGSTGEGFMLCEAERNQVVEVVCAHISGRIPVIAHTGAISTSAAIGLSQAAEAAGAAAISSVPPFYYSFSREEILGYYSDLASSTKLPLFVYNIPATTGIDLSIADLEVMFQIPNVVGLKYTSNNIFAMERIKNLPSAPIVFSGSDEMSYYGLWAGADALVGSSYNLLADIAADMVRLFGQGDYAAAHDGYKLGSELLHVLLQFPYFAAVRRAMAWDGCDIGAPRKPFTDLSREQERQLAQGLWDVLQSYPEAATNLRQRLPNVLADKNVL